jgi:hypothetical protein
LEEEKSKHACLAQENGFGSAFLHSLLRLLKMQQNCAPAKEECTHIVRRITKGVSHCGLAIYIKKYVKANEELWKLKYFTMQKYNLKKKN